MTIGSTMLKIPSLRVVLASCLMMLTGASAAQSYPDKPIRVIVPLGPGAAADVAGRVVMNLLSKQLGQPIIVENKPGAGGTIGTAMVAHAPPDGYTLLLHSNSLVVAAATYRTLSFDTAEDLVGVTPIGLVPLVFVSSPVNGINSLADLTRIAKAKPGSINYASSGIGSATHLGAERLRISADITATHIPMKSTAEALTEVLTGRVDYALAILGQVQGHLQAGRLTALAVSSPLRSKIIPDVPTTAEAGLKGAEYETWLGVFAPAKTPPAIVERLNSELAKVLSSPELQTRFNTMVMTPYHLSSKDFNAFVKKDMELNRRLVMDAGLQKDAP